MCSYHEYETPLRLRLNSQTTCFYHANLVWQKQVLFHFINCSFVRSSSLLSFFQSIKCYATAEHILLASLARNNIVNCSNRSITVKLLLITTGGRMEVHGNLQNKSQALLHKSLVLVDLVIASSLLIKSSTTGSNHKNKSLLPSTKHHQSCTSRQSMSTITKCLPKVQM